MIGLDTNALLRYLAQDDPVQSKKAAEIIEQRLTEQEPGFISVVTMAEMVWVLDRAYRLADADIAPALVVQSEQEVFAAMIALKQGPGSFADALIGALGIKAGCSGTITFDRRALRLPGFALA
jgi:predicted nucleic-acid-binding protein